MQMFKAFQKLLLFFIFNLTIAIAVAQTNPYNLQPGDILFQDLDCGAACDAIENVTEGANGMDFSHCGIVVLQNGEYKIVEAYGNVRATPVAEFVSRIKDVNGRPKILAGRPKNKDLATKSATIALQFIGKGYDDAFDLTNDSYYCSELVYECYRQANGNKPYFPLNRMTFKEPGTDEIMPFWKEYYAKLKKPVPEDEPGINPGAMSRNKNLDLFQLPETN